MTRTSSIRRIILLCCLLAPAGAASETRRVEPRSRRERLELAYSSIREKRLREAAEHLDKAVSEEPGDMRARMDLAYVRQSLGQTDAAAEQFRVVWSREGEFQEQARQALKALKGEPREGAARNRPLEEGYEALRLGDRALARSRFEAALAQEPGRVEVRRQLGYLSLAEGDLASAAASFETARRADPGDYVSALQLGYIYESLRNKAKAEESFEHAAKSPDPKIRESAEAALKNLRVKRKLLYLDLYASPFYTARFANRIAFLEAQLGVAPSADSPVRLYLGGRYIQDSRSRSGIQPQIYSDNAALLGFGVRLQPKGWNTSLNAETNIAYNLTRGPDHPEKSEADYRVILSDYRYWDWPRARRLFVDLGGSVGYFSRYRDNVIGLLQLRQGVKLVDDGRARFSFYVPVNVIKDRNDDFFNNLVEVGGGIELQPTIKENIRLRAEALRGVYFGIEGRDRNPYGPNYEDFRLMLVYTKRFASPR